MNKETKRLNRISNYYFNKQYEIDQTLSNFRYRIIKKFFKGRTCLEIGVADGNITKNLVNDFKELTVVDGSKYLLSKIKKFKNITKINELIENLDTKEKFDTIILSNVLEHVKHPNTVLKKIKKLLNNSGRFIISVPNADSIHRLVAVEMGILKKKTSLNDTDKSLGHRRVYTVEKLKFLLNKQNFKIIDFKGIFLKVLSNKQIDKYFDKQMIDGFNKIGKKLPQLSAEICFICTKK